jgi:hypothetical protein
VTPGREKLDQLMQCKRFGVRALPLLRFESPTKWSCLGSAAEPSSASFHAALPSRGCKHCDQHTSIATARSARSRGMVWARRPISRRSKQKTAVTDRRHHSNGPSTPAPHLSRSGHRCREFNWSHAPHGSFIRGEPSVSLLLVRSQRTGSGSSQISGQSKSSLISPTCRHAPQPGVELASRSRSGTALTPAANLGNRYAQFIRKIC